MRGIIFCLLIVACSGDTRVRRGGVVDGGPDAFVVSDAGPFPDIPRIDSGPIVCLSGTTNVEVALDINIEQSCAIWNSLDELSGDAVVSRAGRAFSIDFGGSVIFAGTVEADGTVSLSYVHPHSFSDGCGWQADETMVGTFDTACTLSLSYDYRESVAINRGGCATPCSADADVDLILTPLI